MEVYLKYQAADDEKDLNVHTYLVKDKITGELVGYFTLRSGLITIQAYQEEFDTIPAVELSNLAINREYREKHKERRRMTFIFLKSFILPLATAMSRYIGVASLYIYALPEDDFIEHYTKMGFTRLPAKQEKFVQNHVKPKYDEDCVFMFQNS